MDKKRRAIISVSDKTGIVELAKELAGDKVAYGQKNILVK